MSKAYVGDIGTEIIIDCVVDLSAATDISMSVRKPDGTQHDWAAEVVDDTKIKHVTVADDFDQAGIYRIQPEMTLSGWTGLGETVKLTIYQPHA